VQQRNEYVIFSEPYEGSPSAEAGIKAGDKILKINGQSVVGKKVEDVTTILKGEPGSRLSIEIERPTDSKTYTMQVIRKEIKLPNIPYSGILSDKIGYIKLTQFTENAGNEVKEAFLKLKDEGMAYLILDLRNNGGGLLNEAVNIMNIFVDQNVTIASVKGKLPEQNNVFKTRFPVIDKNIPVVVLVNEYSASASEIVSGAFQDLDRGVIIGKRTFGKGLVQNIVPLSFNTSMKITVSKYYIPSGRCVQNIDYFNHDTLAVLEIPDSLAIPFKTKNGRTVYDKGGVTPDIITSDTNHSNLLIALILNNLIFDYATNYAAKHPSIAPADKFRIDDETFKQFTDFLKDKDYHYTSESEHILEELKVVAQEEKYFHVIQTLYQEILDRIEKEKLTELTKYKAEICDYLSAEIVLRYYYQKGGIMNTLANDPDIQLAKQVLKDSSRYRSILSSKK
jgi:carboxyl-terminal processing protease